MREKQLITLVLLANCLLFAAKTAFSQSSNLGNPPVLNFSKKDYNGGTQVWAITQDQRGVTWFGNNEGLLEFDGSHWRLHVLNNRTIVRSVCADTSGNIYVGGQGEFGYFAPAPNGTMQYHSLKGLLPSSEAHLGDVWDIDICGEGVFFRTDHQVFRYAHGQVTSLFPQGSRLRFMGTWQGRILIQDDSKRFHTLFAGQLSPFEPFNTFPAGTISGLLEYAPDTLLVTTIKDGILYFNGQHFVPWPTQNDAFLKNNIIFCATMLEDGKIALGTSLNGLVTLDRQRRIYHHVNKKSGLQNNTVLSIHVAQRGGLWLGLDNGISFVDVLSPFTTVFPDGDLQGTGYTALVHDHKIYFGTNTGLYATDWATYYSPDQRRQFSKVAHSEGQVWSLSELQGRLLMGHHEGPFEVHGLNARKLTDLMGVWRFLSIEPDWAVAGHYNGLALFRSTPNGWAYERLLDGLAESSRLLAKDEQGNIWMAHPYRGVYRLNLSADKTSLHSYFYEGKQGLPSSNGNHVFQLNHSAVFTGETGVFDYAPATDRFVPNKQFEQVLGSKTNTRYLNQDPKGHIWYANAQEVGMLWVEDHTLGKQVKKVPIPELSNKLTVGFQFILPIDDENVFAATDRGFIHFNPKQYFDQRDSSMRLVLHQVNIKSRTDSILYGGNGAPPKISLHADQNTLSFYFSAPDYPGSDWVRYSHWLEGSEQQWTEWSAEQNLLLSNLRPGEYTLHLKARNPYLIESAPLAFTFTILPPWYKSNWAYAFYIMVLLGIVYGIIERQKRRFDSEKRYLVRLNQQQARDSEEAISRLEKEKLEAEVRHKNQELASATLHIVQKSEVMISIRDELEQLRSMAAANPALERALSQLVKMLEQDARTDENWAHFSQYFDEVHNGFLKRLSEQHAHLSPNDFRLCAYLRLNLSSKEIAALMNISLRGVESSRYRLRKRLGLDTETNLTEYLMRL